MQNNCPQCGGVLREKSGVSKTTGRPYSFTGCSNYPTCKYIENNGGGFQKIITPKIDGNALIMDEISALRKDFNDFKDIIQDYIARNTIKTIEK